MTDVVARGVNFVYAREFVVAERGEAAWPAIVQRMPPEAAAVWNKPLSLLGTYSFSAFKALRRRFAAPDGPTATRHSRGCTSSSPNAA